MCLFSRPFKARPTDIPVLALPSLFPLSSVFSFPIKDGSSTCPWVYPALGLGCWKHLPRAGNPARPQVQHSLRVLMPSPGSPPFLCRERERREKEREEWERQYSRQSRSPSPRYSKYSHGRRWMPRRSPALEPRPWACVCFVLFSFQVENTALPEGKQASPAPWNMTSLPRFSIPSLYPSACGGWPGPLAPLPPQLAPGHGCVCMQCGCFTQPSWGPSFLSPGAQGRDLEVPITDIRQKCGGLGGGVRAQAVMLLVLSLMK